MTLFGVISMPCAKPHAPVAGEQRRSESSSQYMSPPALHSSPHGPAHSSPAHRPSQNPFVSSPIPGVRLRHHGRRAFARRHLGRHLNTNLPAAVGALCPAQAARPVHWPSAPARRHRARACWGALDRGRRRGRGHVVVGTRALASCSPAWQRVRTATDAAHHCCSSAAPVDNHVADHAHRRFDHRGIFGWSLRNRARLGRRIDSQPAAAVVGAATPSIPITSPIAIAIAIAIAANPAQARSPAEHCCPGCLYPLSEGRLQDRFCTLPILRQGARLAHDRPAKTPAQVRGIPPTFSRRRAGLSAQEKARGQWGWGKWWWWQQHGRPWSRTCGQHHQWRWGAR